MKSDYVYDEMNRLNADGVDFVPFSFDDSETTVISSYTKEEWLKNGWEVKSARRYWRFDESGNKVYIKD